METSAQEHEYTVHMKEKQAKNISWTRQKNEASVILTDSNHMIETWLWMKRKKRKKKYFLQK